MKSLQIVTKYEIWLPFVDMHVLGAELDFITRLQHSIVEANSRMALLVETGPVNKFNNLIT